MSDDNTLQDVLAPTRNDATKLVISRERVRLASESELVAGVAGDAGCNALWLVEEVAQALGLAVTE